MPKLLILGCGYCGEWFARALLREGWQVFGTTRSADRAAALASCGITPLRARSPAELPEPLLRDMDALLDSIPLSQTRAGVYASQPQWLPTLVARCSRLRWAGYLSTTGVYGDASGAWVDESHPCRASSPRARARLHAEQAWLSSGLPVEIFRLAGIYGPGRNILDRLRAGGYRVVRWQPPRFSNRIHIEDIVATLRAALRQPQPGRILNVADDLPLPHDQYACELARLIGAPAPIVLSPEEAAATLSPRTLEFFRDSKRIANQRLHELLPALRYPTFRHAWRSLIR